MLFFLFFLFFLLFPVLYFIPGFLALLYKNKNYIIFVLLISVSISVPILRFYLYLTDDASRHFYAAFRFSLYNNFYDIWDFVKSNNNGLSYDYYNYPIYTFILYLFSGSYNYSLISFIFSILVYFCFIYPLVDLYNKSHLNKYVYGLGLLAIIFSNNFRYTTSGMRYCAIVAIIFLLIYLDSKNNFNNKKFIPLYFIPVLIHQSAILYFILRLFYSILKKNNIMIFLLIILSYPLIINGLYIIDDFVNIAYLEKIIDKISVYESNDAYAEFFTFTLKARIYLSIILSILYIKIYYSFGRFYVGENKSFIDFTLYVTLLNISMIPYQNLIDRNVFLLIPCIILSMLLIIKEPNFNKYNNRIVIYIVFFVLLLTGIVYNRNYPFALLDYNKYELITSNLIDYFTNLPIYI
ncbi:EpsG family protein [Gemelliphila palaticanis]|uniref:EpsG family protein n=1 Tax=Gemelliphila palaticanis TaxID=81950 RepID=A0ABX2SZ32_9BACL|nr:EpsG family protein [Gemella palaticanis]MBF0715594.1 EpsG family protein [Gemella palaticanis]NYS47524.1 EpsG family protein [Gemella palaticanis]